MVKKIDDAVTDFNDQGVSPDEWEFETVSEEFPTRVIFDTIGDEFIGKYLRTDRVEANNGDKFNVYLFDGTDGDRYSVSDNARLRPAMAKVKPGRWCRIVYIADIPTSQDNPMKDFRVDVRK
jgi:hypothetical protein